MAKKTKNSSKAFNFLVPFLPDGSVPWDLPKAWETSYQTGYDYTTRQKKTVPIIWKENISFKAGLKFKTVRSSRSSVQMILSNTETNVSYFMREVDFEAFMPNSTWLFGVCIGEWKFKSYGGYCSIVPADINY